MNITIENYNFYGTNLYLKIIINKNFLFYYNWDEVNFTSFTMLNISKLGLGL